MKPLITSIHPVRTPLNHIIKWVHRIVDSSMLISSFFSYLEMALNGQLYIDTRENLSQSHAASKV